MFDLARRRLYLCVPYRDDMTTFLPAVLRGGVNVVQLREKTLPRELQIVTANIMVPICRDFDVPFIMNDSPDLALAVGADGVHVGQDDIAVADCRLLLGDDAIIGLSTHATSEFEQALPQRVTYLSAGPIVATPTKPGRIGTGTQYAIECQQRTGQPVYVTGGVNADNIAALVALGLRHFVVVRAVTQSSEPESTARAIRQALDEALLAVSVEPT